MEVCTVTLTSVLYRENGVCTPRVGADKHQVLALKGWKFVAVILPSILSGENGA